MSKRPSDIVVTDLPFHHAPASKKARQAEYDHGQLQQLPPQPAAYMPAALPYDYSYVTSPSSDYGYTASPSASSDVSSIDFAHATAPYAGASPAASSAGDFAAPYPGAAAPAPGATFNTNVNTQNNTAAAFALPSSSMSSAYAAIPLQEQCPSYTQADIDSCFDDDFDLEVEINTAMGLRMRPRPTESPPASALPADAPGAGPWPSHVSLPLTFGMQVEGIPGGPNYAGQYPANGPWAYTM